MLRLRPADCNAGLVEILRSVRRLRGFERLGELVAGVKFVDGVPNNKIKRTQVQPQQAAA